MMRIEKIGKVLLGVGNPKNVSSVWWWIDYNNTSIKDISETNNNANPQPNIKEFYYQSILTPNAIPQLCKELTSTEIIDDDVEKYLSEMAGNFMNTVFDSACAIAKHKHSDKVEIEDFASAINDNFGIYEPSLYTADINQMNINSIKNSSTNDHKKRLELTKEETKNVNI